MLRKINIKITKLLFYIKNNFLGFVFKSSVFATMLILVYLVCVLRQADSAKPAKYTVVQPIESSQKLMLIIPTESALDEDSTSTTTEVLTTIDNFIPKTIIYMDGERFFPVQEQTTTLPTAPIYTTTQPSFVKVITTTENNVIPSPESTILSTFRIWESTTISMDQLSTTESTYTMDQTQTTTEFSTIAPAPLTTTEWPAIDSESTTLSPIETTKPAKTDDLFMDNWSSYLPKVDNNPIVDIPIENPIDSSINVPLVLETTTHVVKKETSGFFANEGEDFDTMAVPTPQQHLLEDIITPESTENHKPEHIPLTSASNEGKLLPLETPPLLNPSNLLNLFAIDHLPAASNMKFSWWPRRRKEPVAAASSTKYTVVKSDGSNAILRNENIPEKTTTPPLFHKRNQFEELDSFLNEKLKDSVSLLERLFGNFLE